MTPYTFDDIVRITLPPLPERFDTISRTPGWINVFTADQMCDYATAAIERYESAFHELKQWAQAYPLSVFPEPDFAKAHAVLQEHGMTIDAISASAMRHVIKQVEKIIDRAARDGLAEAVAKECAERMR